ncbi:MAG: activator-dependent family glycosyltransferase [Pseudonocardiaceae bacterium]
MKVLFVCMAHNSHYFPLVPMAWALRTAGHDVRVAAPPELTGTVTQTGLTAVPVGVAEWNENGDTRASEMYEQLLLAGGSDYVQHFDWRDQGGWTWEGLLTLENLMVSALYDPLNNSTMIDNLVAFARDWQPDLVIRENHTHAGGIVARVIGAAHARLVYGPDITTRARQVFTRQAEAQPPEHREDPTGEWLERSLQRFGCHFDDEILTGQWTIDPTPPSTRLDLGLHTVGVRYVPFNGPSELPDWLRTPPARPRICLTGGLAARDGGEPAFSMADILEGMADLDVDIIATLDAAQFDQVPVVPDNTRVVEFVPFHELLPTCAAVVHHGGSGTRATAEFHGVPQVIVAIGWDTLVKVPRLEELGVALSVSAAEVTPAILREKVSRVLEDPSFTEAARRLRAEVLAQPTPNDIVPLLEKLTTEHRTFAADLR